MTEFTSTESARSEAEEKKSKKIAKANEAKLKGRDWKTGKKDQYQGKYTSGTGGSTRKGGHTGDEGRSREDRECFNCRKVGYIFINCRVKDGKGAGSGRGRGR